MGATGSPDIFKRMEFSPGSEKLFEQERDDLGRESPLERLAKLLPIDHQTHVAACTFFDFEFDPAAGGRDFGSKERRLQFNKRFFDARRHVRFILPIENPNAHLRWGRSRVGRALVPRFGGRQTKAGPQ